MELLRQLRSDLEAFIGGRDHGVLILHGAAKDLGYVYTILAEIEAGSADVYAYFPDRFTGAADYVHTIVERVSASEVEAGAAAPGGEADDPRLRPGERVQAAIVRARRLLGARGDGPRLIAALLPLGVADPLAYRRLVAELLAPPLVGRPWFCGARILLHDDSLADAGLAAPPLVRRLAVDLSREAMAGALTREAEDPALPELRRAQALLQVATMDVGRRRFARAIDGFQRILALPTAAATPALAALAMHGLGDAERLRGRPDVALAWFERALIPASAARAPIVLLLVARGLAELHFAAHRPALAAEYYDGLARLAAALPDPETEASARLQHARCKEALGAREEAARSLLAAGRVARANDRGGLLGDARRGLAAIDGKALPAGLRAEITAFYAEAEG